MSKPELLRTNDQIRVNEVRLVGADGSQIGIVPIREALVKAQEAGMDLVEVAPEATPPVCRIYDYKKALYEKKKKAKESKKKAHQSELKEVKLRVSIGDHDRLTKLKKAREFFERGDKVKFTVIFRGREVTRPELGERLIDKVQEDLKDIAEVETRPTKMGRQVNFMMQRRKDWAPGKNMDKAREKEKDTAAASGKAG